jgi:hypothetical protein
MKRKMEVVDLTTDDENEEQPRSKPAVMTDLENAVQSITGLPVECCHIIGSYGMPWIAGATPTHRMYSEPDYPNMARDIKEYILDKDDLEQLKFAINHLIDLTTSSNEYEQVARGSQSIVEESFEQNVYYGLLALCMQSETPERHSQCINYILDGSKGYHAGYEQEFVTKAIFPSVHCIRWWKHAGVFNNPYVQQDVVQLCVNNAFVDLFIELCEEFRRNIESSRIQYEWVLRCGDWSRVAAFVERFRDKFDGESLATQTAHQVVTQYDDALFNRSLGSLSASDLDDDDDEKPLSFADNEDKEDEEEVTIDYASILRIPVLDKSELVRHFTVHDEWRHIWGLVENGLSLTADQRSMLLTTRAPIDLLKRAGCFNSDVYFVSIINGDVIEVSKFDDVYLSKNTRKKGMHLALSHCKMNIFKKLFNAYHKAGITTEGLEEKFLLAANRPEISFHHKHSLASTKEFVTESFGYTYHHNNLAERLMKIWNKK